jgi:8-oxo-dGTP pyrophosphatase MutT (NUDIX family)
MAFGDYMWSGAFVCVFDKEYSRILMLKRKHNKEWEDKGGWGNVGGSVEPGETPVEACIREAKEEIGIDMKPEDLSLVHVRKVPETEPYEYIMHFYATSIDNKSAIILNDESYEYRWFGLDELPDNMLDGKKDILEWRGMAIKHKV